MALFETMETFTHVTGALSTESGDTIAKQLKAFITPLLLLIFGVVALTFLFKREMTKFFQFAAIAVLVGVFWFNPQIVQNVSNFVFSLF
jgi:hypothetical protein